MSLSECRLSIDDLLGFGVRQILGASPQTSCKQAGKYMAVIRDTVGGDVSVVNFPTALAAWKAGTLTRCGSDPWICGSGASGAPRRGSLKSTSRACSTPG